LDLLWPIKWVIELILVTFHNLFVGVGIASASGISWVLAIVGLVLVVRAALIPIFVKQIKSQRNMMMVQPELQKLQKKYKGKTDRDSKERFAKEQMALYKRTGSNPLSSCLPLLLQMPIFFSLFIVLNTAQQDLAGVGSMVKGLASSFSQAEIFGAKLSATFFGSDEVNVKIIAGIMIVLMSASQFITQKQIMSKNQNPATQNSQFMQTQKIMLYALPLVFLFSGLTFPLGVMTYWLVSNFWTMGQQFVVIRNMPTPGSPAHEAREDRLIKKGKITREEPKAIEAAGEVVEEEKPPQRVQPVSKNRAKKKKK
jgi:YidC/Oxa1 family membrane protein insertase